MRILIRDNSKNWNIAESIRAKAESELQKLLIESPSLVMINEIRDGVTPLIFAVREFGLPGSGATDVLAFSLTGDIAIIECKLAANPEIKRKVIGQILEYAAYLWQMSYEDVDERIRKREGRSLTELVEDSALGDWDEESFRNGVIQSLENGSFILVIVVDELNEELKRIIRYINECSESAFSLHALEMRRFQADKVEVLVPHLYGVSSKPPAGGKRRMWSEAEFMRVYKEAQPDSFNVVKDLYEWSRGEADRIWFGTGKETGSFTFHYLLEGKTISVFTIYTNGKLMLNYHFLSPQIPEELMREFHERLHQISSLSRIPSDFTKFPSIRVIEAFADSENLKNFKTTIKWLGEQLQS